MSQELWAAVDEFICGHFVPGDEALEGALAASEAAGLPAIQVTPNVGKFLQILAQSIGARRILEIGALAGYSTIWLARGLAPGGRLVTLEVDPKHAEIARANLARAGLADVVELKFGRAIDALPRLQTEGVGPFDLVFIDADKPSTADYFDWAVRLGRPGTLIVVDNMVRGGAVLEEQTEDASVRGARRFYERAAADKRVSCTAIQMVSGKGYDGVAIARVK